MSDKLATILDGTVVKRFKDMGDGTVAEVFALEGVDASGISANIVGTMQRPADNTAYAVGDLIANAVAAGAVQPIALQAARKNGGTGMVRRLRLKANSLAWLNAAVRIHLYRDNPVCANGDNGQLSTSESNYMGYADVTLDRQFTDPFVKGIAAPSIGSEMNFDAAVNSRNIYALLEARTAVAAPGSGTAFSLVAETLQN